MLNKEIITALENAMSDRNIDDENQKIIKKFLNDLSTNSIKEKSERNAFIRNILSRLGAKDGS